MTGPHLSNGDTPTRLLPSGLIRKLRTPLNAIIGYSELLIEQTQEQGQHGLVPDLQKILIAGQQLLALINTNFHPVRALDSFVGLSSPQLAAEQWDYTYGTESDRSLQVNKMTIPCSG